jgi:hypothetical protein
MSEDRFRELSALAALGMLDGEDLASYRDHEASCAACRSEREAFERVVGRIPLSLDPVPPSPRLREALRFSLGMPTPRRWVSPALAAAALLALAFGFLVVRTDRQAAERDFAEAKNRVALLEERAKQAELELTALKEKLAEEGAFQRLVSNPDSRMAHLAGQKNAPSADACIVWNAKSGEAVLMASGLPPAPQGMAYEVWVIAQKAPIPAGVFEVDKAGKALFRLPALQEVERVKTFAVTIEPAAGTLAPTGPMVLAGAVS